MRNILVIYASRQHPQRASQRDHLRSFKKYATDYRVYYANLAFGGVPIHLRCVQFDLVIFHWLFVGGRADRAWFQRKVQELRAVGDLGGVKVAMPQDEFVCMDLLCKFISEFDVQHVFSVAPESEWPKLYPTVDRTRVKFHRVLTGYLDDRVVAEFGPLSAACRDRSIGIGYRTVSTAIWGRFNLVKSELAKVFERLAPEHGLTTDIAVGAQHFLLGDDWLHFLMRCKYTLGVEGGSSLLDWDGSLMPRITKYLADNPSAGFDELEGTVIPSGRDGEIAVYAVSPRHLEACLTRTCQVLISGEYNGILKPGVHFIELARDFGNIDATLEAMKDELLRERLVENAFRDVVASGRYSYSRFVSTVIGTVLEELPRKPARGLRETSDSFLLMVNSVIDSFDWAIVRLYSVGRRLRDLWRSAVSRA